MRHFLRARRRGGNPPAGRDPATSTGCTPGGTTAKCSFSGFDLFRRDPLECRKVTLASLLRRSRDGIQLIEHIEATDGRTVFEHACKLGLEGILSKRRDKPYQHGRSRTWLKVRNPASPAAKRIEEGSF